MSSASRLKFRGITRGIFSRLSKRAAQNGIQITAKSGTAKKDGITIQWKYDVCAELLEVECVHSPFWIDNAKVNGKISEEIRSVLDSVYLRRTLSGAHGQR